MLHRPYFTELFLTRSSARPRLLLAIEQSNVWHFFSLLQPQNKCEKSSSLVVAAEFHTKFPGDDNMWICCSNSRQFSCGYASGLIYFSSMWISEKSKDYVPVICNPNTGQYVTLPKLARYKISYSFLGFDPVDKEYKVLFMAYPYCSERGDHKILTLGTGKMRWRKIQCSLTHEPLSEGICINGSLYYSAEDINETLIVICFDVRYEKFTFIRLSVSTDWYFNLISYKGKLCVINWKNGNTNDAIELRMSILEDVEKQEWSKHDYTLPDNKLDDGDEIDVVGVSAMTGEIIFSMQYTSKPFYVFFYNPEKNTLQSVEIQGLAANHETSLDCNVYTIIDHVEDLNVNDAKVLKSSIYAPYMKKKRFRKKRKTPPKYER